MGDCPLEWSFKFEKGIYLGKLHGNITKHFIFMSRKICKNLLKQGKGIIWKSHCIFSLPWNKKIDEIVLNSLLMKNFTKEKSQKKKIVWERIWLREKKKWIKFEKFQECPWRELSHKKKRKCWQEANEEKWRKISKEEKNENMKKLFCAKSFEDGGIRVIQKNIRSCFLGFWGSASLNLGEPGQNIWG